MNDLNNIYHIPQENIDKQKWDECISKASNGLVYGYSFYLDHMSNHWDALVLNDYEIVLPLTWNRKFGVCYLYQPFLAAQLGVFGNHLNAALVNSFLQAIPGKFKYWDISLNYGNVFDQTGFNFYQRKNYILDLSKSYESLYKQFSENIQRNIKKAEQAGCYVQQDINVEWLIPLALQQMKNYAKKADENVNRFRKLYHYLYERKQAITYGVFTKENKLLSSCVFFFSHNRAYYILVGNHPDGKEAGASHAVIHAFIKDYAGRNIILDFEGSDIPGLALFYKSFGAVEENYAAIKRNRLPFYMRWLKK
jgi:hypothetical protein